MWFGFILNEERFFQRLLCTFLEAHCTFIVSFVEVFLTQTQLHFSHPCQVQCTILFEPPCERFQVDETTLELFKYDHPPACFLVQFSFKRHLFDKCIGAASGTKQARVNLICIVLRIRL